MISNKIENTKRIILKNQQTMLQMKRHKEQATGLREGGSEQGGK